MEIEYLNLDDFDINEYNKDDIIDVNIDENIDENDAENMMDDNDTNVFFSYPYYSHNDIDYQYRFTIEDRHISIDEIQNNNKLEFDNINVIKHITNLDIDKFNKCLYSLIDFRDYKTKLENGIINLNLEELNNEEKMKIISKNKIYVLYEIYNIFLE